LTNREADDLIGYSVANPRQQHHGIDQPDSQSLTRRPRD
jgi:hypothetical protein